MKTSRERNTACDTSENESEPNEQNHIQYPKCRNHKQQMKIRTRRRKTDPDGIWWTAIICKGTAIILIGSCYQILFVILQWWIFYTATEEQKPSNSCRPHTYLHQSAKFDTIRDNYTCRHCFYMQTNNPNIWWCVCKHKLIYVFSIQRV